MKLTSYQKRDLRQAVLRAVNYMGIWSHIPFSLSLVYSGSQELGELMDELLTVWYRGDNGTLSETEARMAMLFLVEAES